MNHLSHTIMTYFVMPLKEFSFSLLRFPFLSHVQFISGIIIIIITTTSSEEKVNFQLKSVYYIEFEFYFRSVF